MTICCTIARQLVSTKSFREPGSVVSASCGVHQGKWPKKRVADNTAAEVRPNGGSGPLTLTKKMQMVCNWSEATFQSRQYIAKEIWDKSTPSKIYQPGPQTKDKGKKFALTKNSVGSWCLGIKGPFLPTALPLKRGKCCLMLTLPTH